MQDKIEKIVRDYLERELPGVVAKLLQGPQATSRSEAAKKAWVTRRRSSAANKAWATRRKNARKP